MQSSCPIMTKPTWCSITSLLPIMGAPSTGTTPAHQQPEAHRTGLELLCSRLSPTACPVIGIHHKMGLDTGGGTQSS